MCLILYTAMLVDIIEFKHNWAFEYTVITIYSAKMTLFMRAPCHALSYDA